MTGLETLKNGSGLDEVGLRPNKTFSKAETFDLMVSMIRIARLSSLDTVGVPAHKWGYLTLEVQFKIQVH